MHSDVIPSQPMSQAVWPLKKGQMISAVPRWISRFIASRSFPADDPEGYAGRFAAGAYIRLGKDVGDPDDGFIDLDLAGDGLCRVAYGEARIVESGLFVAHREVEVGTVLRVRLALMRLDDVSGEDGSGRGSSLLVYVEDGSDVLVQPAPEGIGGNQGLGADHDLREVRSAGEQIHGLIGYVDQRCGLLDGDCQRRAGHRKRGFGNRDGCCLARHGSYLLFDQVK